MIHRGQVIVRDCGPSRKSYSSKSIVEEYRNDYAILGIVEVDADGYPQHVIQEIFHDRTQAEPSFWVNDRKRPFKGEGPGNDIGDLARNTIWPRPNPEFGMGGGGILLRDNRMPARPGRKTCFILGITSLFSGSLLNHHIYDVGGRLDGPSEAFLSDFGRGGAIQLSTPVDSQIEIGLPLSSLMKLPLWGWGEEKVGFISTMDLATIDICSRIEHLMAIGHRTENEQAELDAFMKSDLGWIFSHTHRDEEYRKFREEMLKVRPNRPWDSIMTKSEMEADENLAETIIRRMLTDCPS